MEKDEKIAEPQAKNETPEQVATKPITAEREVLIPVKFNKEIKELTVDKVTELAQKGLKFDAISNEYNLLKELALKSGKSVAQFLEQIKAENYNKRKKELLEKCSGDQALTEHILNLEAISLADENLNFGELKKEFPQFSSVEQIPSQVLENAKLSGRSLLDEYLRYRLAEKKNFEKATKNEKKAEEKSLGSQLSRQNGNNPETAEFLKGLWK